MNVRSLSFIRKTLVTLCIALAPTRSFCGEPVAINLDLAEAVETALIRNLGLQLKKADLASAEGTALSAHGAFAPLLSADFGAGEQSNTPVTGATAEKERTTTWNAGVQKRFSTGTELELSWNNDKLDTTSDFYLFDKVYSSGVTLEISQPLLRGFGPEVQKAEINAAKSRREAASFLVDSEAADLGAQVKKAYWDLVFAHQNLDVLLLSLTLAEKLRDDTATKIKAGTLADIDLYQPQSEVAQREQRLISGEQAVGIAEDNLKLLMNSNDWPTPFNPVDIPATEPISPDIDAVLDKALANRPDVKAATLQIQASRFQVKKSENDILPHVNLFGAVGFGGTAQNYGDAFDNSVNDADTNWRLGLMFSRPLDNSAAKGTHRLAQAHYNKNRIALELLTQEIRRAVRSTVRDIELALKTIEATTKTALATRKRLEAEQIKFDAGRSTTLDVLIAQQDYAQALSNENRAKVSYARTRAELDRIQGLITLSE